MRTRLGIFLLLVCGGIQCVRADTTWVAGSLVYGNWTRDGSPYMLTREVSIPPDSTLSIGPGVTVFFAAHFIFGIYQRARLLAIGAEGDSVYFTTDTLAFPARWEGFWIYEDADTCRFEYCVVENARTPGIGTHLIRGSTRLLNSTFRHNTAGYGVVLLSFADVQITGCVFESNRAQSGGGFWVAEAQGIIEDCCFRNNHATSGTGGAIGFSSQHASLTVRRCDFIGNSAVNGGAVYLQTGSGGLVFEDCRFAGNRSDSAGGAVGSQVNVASAQFMRCTFDSNHAGGSGGGMQICHATLVDQCVLTHNAASLGGAIYIEEPQCGYSPTIQRSTLANNTALQDGAGIYLADWAAVRSNIVAFSGNGFGIRVPPQGAPAAEEPGYNLLFGNAAGDFSVNQAGYGFVVTENANGDSCDTYYNLFLDPQFADTAAGDYHLTAGSPCIDAGDPGLPRDPDGTVADMGAFYYDQVAVDDRTPSSPSAFTLEQNYPNPFNAATRIGFEIARAGIARLDVFDVLGRRVRTLHNGLLISGRHEFTFAAADLPSGVYVYRLATSGQMAARKMLLLR